MKLVVCKNNLEAKFCTKVPTLVKNGLKIIINKIPKNTPFKKAELEEPLKSHYFYNFRNIDNFDEIFFTRDPFSRFVASYRDKIERIEGRQFFYDKITRPLLQVKYPNSLTPKYGWSWNSGTFSNLTMTPFSRTKGFGPKLRNLEIWERSSFSIMYTYNL